MAQLKTTKEIGLMAIEVHQCMKERKLAKMRLKEAYIRWAHNTKTFHHFERESPEWDRMMAATDPEFLALEEAKRRERNAARRLERAISQGVRV